MALEDTSAKAREAYWRRLGQMTPEERVNIGCALWEAGEKSMRAAILRRFPGADAAEVTFQLAVMRFGEELARKAYGRQ